MTPSTVGVSPNHFTGKERDSESGLDYFGSRYYSSTVGRWFSPDWSATPVPVPYASLGAPQSLNLYSYRGNNPSSGTDTDGHCWPLCDIINRLTFEGSMFLARHPDVGEKAAEVPGSVSGKGTAGLRTPKELPVSSSVTLNVTGSSQGIGVNVEKDTQAGVGGAVRTTTTYPIVQNSQLVNPVTNATTNQSVVVEGPVGPLEAEASVNNNGQGTVGVQTAGDTGFVGAAVSADFGDVFHAIGDGVISDVVGVVQHFQNAFNSFTETQDSSLPSTLPAGAKNPN